MGGSFVNMRCDRLACPAPALRQTLIYGQDFYFCNHHHAELAEFRATLPSESPPAERRHEASPLCRLALEKLGGPTENSLT